MKKALLPLFIFLSATAYSQIITTVAGGATGHGGYWGDGGLATNAQFAIFPELAIDYSGNMYIADGNNERIRKVDIITSIVNTIAGNGIAGYNGDGIPATSAKLNQPALVFLDNLGNYYIVDANNYRIRKVDTLTRTINTFAFNGTLGYSADGTLATSANFDLVNCAFDSYHNLIYSSKYHCIRKISSSGIITTIAGTGVPGNAGDGGPATLATMVPGVGLCIDRFNNIYFSDSFNSVRKINASTGIITRVAGTGDGVGYPYCCDGVAATTAHILPFGIAVDDTGNLYIASYTAARIEKVDTFGIIHTVAGTGINGFSGDGGIATAAKLDHPEGVTLDRCGNVYIADFNNARVRKITVNPSCDLTTLNINYHAIEVISVYPNPAHDELKIINPTVHGAATITNMLGYPMLHIRLNEKQSKINIESLPAGVYFVKVTDGDGNNTVTRITKL